MSMHKQSMALAVVAALAAVGVVLADDGPGLGEPLTAAEIEDGNFVVMPSGDGLPEGSGTAVEGEEIYRVHCLSCHGERGEGGLSDRLAGGHGSLDGSAPVRTVGSYWPYATTAFDYIRRAMPYQEPDVLSADEVYAVTAYLLYVNDIVERRERLDAATLPEVKMPNQDGFKWAWPDDR